jgi:hypothetical protein
MPLRISAASASVSRPTRSDNTDRSTVTIWDTFATESLDNPLRTPPPVEQVADYRFLLSSKKPSGRTAARVT